MNAAKLSLWLSTTALAIGTVLFVDRFAVAWLATRRGSALRTLLLVADFTGAGVALGLCVGRGQRRSTRGPMPYRRFVPFGPACPDERCPHR